jgi:hypothetical protein
VNPNCFQGSTEGPRADEFVVLLDGVAGQPRVTSTDVYFSWATFPTSPGVLQISYETGSAGCLDLQLELADATCEIDNPPPDCPG